MKASIPAGLLHLAMPNTGRVGDPGTGSKSKRQTRNSTNFSFEPGKGFSTEGACINIGRFV